MGKLVQFPAPLPFGQARIPDLEVLPTACRALKTGGYAVPSTDILAKLDMCHMDVENILKRGVVEGTFPDRLYHWRYRVGSKRMAFEIVFPAWNVVKVVWAERRLGS